MALSGNEHVRLPDGRFGPMAIDSVRQYWRKTMQGFDEAFGDHHGGNDPEVKTFLRGLANKYGDMTVRARPVTLDDLQRMIHGAREYMRGRASTFTDLDYAHFAFSALVTFWGFLRLGAVFPGGPARQSNERAVALTLADFAPQSDGTLDASLTFSKTNQTMGRVHRFKLVPCPYAPLCPVRAYWELVGILGDGSRAEVRGRLDFTNFLNLINTVCPALHDPPADIKAQFTGHSFRRGAAQLARQYGCDSHDIMLFGDWKSPVNMVRYLKGSHNPHYLADLVFYSA